MNTVSKRRDVFIAGETNVSVVPTLDDMNSMARRAESWWARHWCIVNGICRRRCKPKMRELCEIVMTLCRLVLALGPDPRVLIVCATFVGGASLSAAQDSPMVWYVQSALETDPSRPGAGTADAPFRSLAEVKAAAAPGDEIRVLAPLPGAPALDGGIVLQAGQRLLGAEVAGFGPGITNTDPGRRGGDAVTLADDCVVTGLLIAGAAGHAIVGRNVAGAMISGNQIQGGNLAGLTSVTTGATAGLGVPAFPKAVVAFIHDETAMAEKPARANTVSGNTIGGQKATDGELIRLGGASIALHARGSGRASLIVSENRISDLGAGFPRSGVLVDTQDAAVALIDIQDTSVANAHASSDGILIVAQHRSAVTASIRRYRYIGGTPELGVGNNGLEVVTYFGSNRLQAGTSTPEQHAAQSRVLMEESDIEGAGGFGIAVWNIFGKPSSDTVLDLGGGELGGRGANRIYANGTELPASMDVYVVNHDLNIANNWWGADRAGKPKATRVDGSWQLGSAYQFACPGEPDQLQRLNAGTGTTAWSMFCQVLRDDVCTKDAALGMCCDPTTDPAGCLVAPAASRIVSAPALVDDPRRGQDDPRRGQDQVPGPVD